MDFISFVYAVVFCILSYVGGRLHERYRPRRKLTPTGGGTGGGLPVAQPIVLSDYREMKAATEARYAGMWKREETGTDG